MKTIISTLIIFAAATLVSCSQSDNNNTTMKYNKLTTVEERVILKKGTELPFTGEYYNHKAEGKYLCKQCDAPLYNSSDKFDSECGWPSFDDEIEGAVKRIPDRDGRRTEIVCTNCGGHLGHVFIGEHFTEKDTRHCVNSISLKFISKEQEKNTDTAIFASGCFWGTEYYLQKKEGVIITDVGYTGGHMQNPTYKDVCTGKTGHAEAVRVIYDKTKVSYEELAKLFFETHDPTQINRQGPDIGEQYRSAIFYTNEKQKETAQKLINALKDKGYKVATELTPASEFYIAEDHHQDYYEHKGSEPYCHIYEKKF